MSERRQKRGRRIVDDPIQSKALWDRDLEEEFVGWTIANSDRAVEIVGDGLRHSHFHGYRARTIFQAIEDLVTVSKEPHLDAIAVALEQRGVTDVRKLDLVQLHSIWPFRGGPWEDRARMIRDAARRRALSYALQGITERITYDEFEAVRADLYAALDETKDAVHPVEYDKFSNVMSDVWHDYHRGSQMIPTQIGSIDERIRGIRRGTYVLLGARTSVGKTALAVTLAATWARMGIKVSFISVEMDRIAIGQRYAGVLGNVSVAALSAGEMHPADIESFSRVVQEDLPIAINSTARTLSQARSRVMQHRRMLGGLDVAIIDYVQLMQTDDGDNEQQRYRELGKISQGLKFLAQDTGAVVIALAQLSRGASTKKRPTLEDLRESGNLEQDADQVWLLWRNEKRRCMELAIAKNRQGPTGQVKLTYQASATKFVEHFEDAVPADDGPPLPMDDDDPGSYSTADE